MPFNPRRSWGGDDVGSVSRVVGGPVGWDHRCDVGDVDFSSALGGCVDECVISCLVCGRVWRLVVGFDSDRVGPDGRRRVRWAEWRPDVCPGCGKSSDVCRHYGGRRGV